MQPASRPSVLIVEDRPSVLQVLASILERAYQVTTAGDGTRALALLGAGTFDVVLTDIRMPGLSGFEVLRAAMACHPAPCVVMMTAYANVPDAVAAIRIGACDYVSKPVDADEIALVVARAIEQRRGPPEGGVAAQAGRVTAGGVDTSLAFRSAVEAARDEASRRYLLKLMQTFRGNVTHAAAQAGMTRESLHRVLRKYGVRSEAQRAEGEVGAPEPDPARPKDQG